MSEQPTRSRAESTAIRIGAQLGQRALDILAGKQPPAQPRDAATVMLLRPAGADGGLEVYMLRRKSSMAFAPGAFVFPGGSVDARDADEQVAWAGPDPAEWGQIFDARQFRRRVEDLSLIHI